MGDGGTGSWATRITYFKVQYKLISFIQNVVSFGVLCAVLLRNFMSAPFQFLISLHDAPSENHGSASHKTNIQPKVMNAGKYYDSLQARVIEGTGKYLYSEYINNSLHLARKYARIFVRGHYLFRVANSFSRA